MMNFMRWAFPRLLYHGRLGVSTLMVSAGSGLMPAIPMKAHCLCASLLILVTSSLDAGEPSIVGRWTADTRTTGGLGNTLIFGSDGTLVSEYGALVDFQYRVKGQTIQMTGTSPTTGKTEQRTESFEISGNKMVVNPSDSKTRSERTRIGTPKPGAPAIVGIWSFQHYTGRPARMEYTSKGLLQLSVPFQSVTGTYRLQGDLLTTEVPKHPPTKRKIQIAGDHLVFAANGKTPEEKYTRIVP
jgi:hypothetical protein